MASIKTVGGSGQISLGKQYAGRHVLVDEVEPGVWLLKLGDFVPDSERWLHDGGVAESIDRAVEWASDHPAAETDLDDLAGRLGSS